MAIIRHDGLRYRSARCAVSSMAIWLVEAYPPSSKHLGIFLFQSHTSRPAVELLCPTFEKARIETRSQSNLISTFESAMLAPRKTLHSTPLRVFRSALELVDITPHDVFYDVGCGDGRLVIDAAKSYGIRAVGIEIDEARAQQARSAVVAAGVAHLVTIHHGNAMDFDYADATIMFLFLIERGLGLIRAKLEQLPAPCRVLTYLYKFPGALQHDAKHFLRARDSSDEVAFPVFVYSFPTGSQAIGAASVKDTCVSAL